MYARISAIAALTLSLLVMGCSGGSSSSAAKTSVNESPAGAAVTFTAQVWADNWFELYVNGKKVGEDSAPITTVRSFNAETITFTDSYPLTIALVSKDYVEGDSGLEYIGTSRQQMGDGGFIAQVTDTSTGELVATTSSAWKGLVIFRAPLNADCVTSREPDTMCTHEIVPEPAGWTSPTFDVSSWVAAREYTAAEVGPKDGYDTVNWTPDAKLIWSGDLKVDNTILWRTTVVRP